MRHLRNVGLAVLVLVSTSSVALAQRTANTTNASAATGRFWEFGLDFVGIFLGLDDPSSISTSLGAAVLRSGYYFSDVISLEPQLTFGSTSSSGTSSNELGLEVGLLYHLQAERTRNQIYLRPSLIYNRFSTSTGGASTSTSGMGIGAAAGYKRPAKNTKFTWRAEVGFVHMNKRGAVAATNDLNLLLGASAYTR